MTQSLAPASSYTHCNELWCITAYFNPAHYRTRPANYARFAAPLRAAGIPLLTVECAFGDDPFELPPGPDVLQVRARDVLWQKERLINLGVSRLPPHAQKVAWLDGDILFTNPDWAVETAALLDRAVVAQPFARAMRLARGEESAPSDNLGHESFAAVWQRDRSLVRAGSLDVHGHTGFAWAARRDLLTQHGLYDAFITSNGDHFLAHAFAGDFTSRCMQSVRQGSRLSSISRRTRNGRFRALLRSIFPRHMRYALHNLPGVRQPNSPYWAHFLAWGEPVAAQVAGRIGCTSGAILHLWHGDMENRQAGVGRQLLHQQGFDPARDLQIGPSGCLEWATDQPKTRAWLAEFFDQRREDGA
jgi:hypothetical protein